MSKKTFGSTLKYLRVNRGLKRKQLADQLNIHSSTISNYENNVRKPKYAMLKSIAQYFDVSTDYLLNYPQEEFGSLREKILDTEVIVGYYRRLSRNDCELLLSMAKRMLADEKYKR